MERILVATEASDRDGSAVEWATEMAGRYDAELLVLHVVAPEHTVAGGDTIAAPNELADRLAGVRGETRVVYDSDAAAAIVRVAEEERADIVVVGNTSMSERTEFLLASPTRPDARSSSSTREASRRLRPRRRPTPTRRPTRGTCSDARRRSLLSLRGSG